MPLHTNIMDSRFCGNDRRLAYFVIPAKAGIHERLPLNIELRLLIHHDIIPIESKLNWDYYIKLGKNVAICGKLSNKASTQISEKIKGILPYMIARESTLGSTAWHAKSVSPKGGVIMPIS